MGAVEGCGPQVRELGLRGRSGGEKGLRGRGAGTPGVPLGGTRRKLLGWISFFPKTSYLLALALVLDQEDPNTGIKSASQSLLSVQK